MINSTLIVRCNPPLCTELPLTIFQRNADPLVAEDAILQSQFSEFTYSPYYKCLPNNMQRSLQRKAPCREPALRFDGRGFGCRLQKAPGECIAHGGYRISSTELARSLSSRLLMIVPAALKALPMSHTSRATMQSEPFENLMAQMPKVRKFHGRIDPSNGL